VAAWINENGRKEEYLRTLRKRLSFPKAEAQPLAAKVPRITGMSCDVAFK